MEPQDLHLANGDSSHLNQNSEQDIVNMRKMWRLAAKRNLTWWTPAIAEVHLNNLSGEPQAFAPRNDVELSAGLHSGHPGALSWCRILLIF